MTYDTTLSTDKDWVRFLIGDRGPTEKLSDEEIEALLTEEGNKYLAAARAGEVILAQGRGAVSKSVAELSITYGDSPESAYRSHLRELRKKGRKEVLQSGGKSAFFRNL